MGDNRGFLKYKRQTSEYRPVCDRVKDYSEVGKPRSDKSSKEQASRCMDCGTAYCNWGCPIGNYVPEWNDLVFRGQWEAAFRLLAATNPLPEVTGRVCPVLCEYACVLGINDEPVTIRDNELSIVERAFNKGMVRPNPPKARTGKRVAVIGSGPAGLAAANYLNKAGHRVVVFERDENIGGIMRFGIPDFKLDKKILDRRIEIWLKEGIEFKTGVNIGVDRSIADLKKEFNAILLACGSRVPRDLKIEGRDLKGIHFAMDYLTQSNRRVSGENIPLNSLIDAKGKKIVVIGGGDTGADCVGVAHRQGAACVVQIELLPKPLDCRTKAQPWPYYPNLLKTSTSHEEGCERHWEVATKKFIGEGGRVKKLLCSRPGGTIDIGADLVLLAMGFVHPERQGIIEELRLQLDDRGNVKTDETCMTSEKRVFCSGDMRRGQSLIVWAIYEGMAAADGISSYLAT
jgi:glutamate synthase (NADPH/NADH) small chain